MNLVDVVGYILLGLLILGSLIAASTMSDRLDDPNDKSTIYLDQLSSTAKLKGGGKFLVRIFRQSGNLHYEKEVFGAQSAVNTAIGTFRRAKIDGIGITENTESVLRFTRLFHNHRGSSEGKKVGSAEIIQLS